MNDWDFFLVPYSGESRGLQLAIHVERGASELRFGFELRGSGVRHAAHGAGQRRDELWKTTCFELFLGPASEASYFEVNMATSGDWNVYAFDSYRAGMREVEAAESPIQSVRTSDDRIEITGRLDLEGLPGLLVGPVALGATAVVEYKDGSKDYWALAHKGEKPDFHVRDSFIAKI